MSKLIKKESPMTLRLFISVLAILFSFSTSFANNSQNFSQLSAVTIDGQNVSFERYKGKVMLLVNTASGCGYTPQYKNLQALSTKYKAQGLVVLGFPSNDFGGQEPGTNKEIKKFCELNYKVDFQLFTKLPVSGANIQSVFKWLTENSPKELTGPVSWNFEKFIVSKNGQIVKRFRSSVSPDSPEIVSVIEAEIKKTF